MSFSEFRGPAAIDTAGDGQAPAAASHAAIAVREQDVPAPYAGLVTRTIAFAMDAAIVNGTGMVVAFVVGLGLSVLNTPEKLNTVLLAVGGVIFIVWSVAYFVSFWSTTGQTPGMRVMRIRVRQSGADESLHVRWAVVRLGALFLAALPLLLGFLPILLNDRRRGLQDFLGRSVVVHAPGNPLFQVRSSSTS